MSPGGSERAGVCGTGGTVAQGQWLGVSLEQLSVASKPDFLILLGAVHYPMFLNKFILSLNKLELAKRTLTEKEIKDTQRASNYDKGEGKKRISNLP